ncbi:hypothetical protein BC332_05311 [Capsicum chinense]|nr:hypothetical protein BC332_05311 [Capsicum chinense]
MAGKSPVTRKRKQTNIDEEPAAKRGRPRKAPVPFVGTDFATPSNSRGRSTNFEPVSSVGPDFATPSNSRGRVTHVEPVSSVGADFATSPNYRGRATHVESVPSVGTNFVIPPNYRGRATHVKPSTKTKIPPHNAGVSSRTRSGRRRSRGSGYPLESWFTYLKPRLPSRRIVSTGPKQVMKSVVLSRDIGFKPSSELKWKGKQAITTRRL